MMRYSERKIKAVLWIHIGCNGTGFSCLSQGCVADPDPDPNPSNQTNADPDLLIRLKSQKIEFSYEKYT
jgi:hypothetical protein